MRPAIVFDLDGTLVDSHLDIAWALNLTLDALGFPRRPPEEVRGMIGHGLRELLRQALAASPGAPVDSALLEAGRAHFAPAYAACASERTRPYPGIPEVLAALTSAGYALGVATNKPARHTEAILRDLGLVGAGIRAWASADEVPSPKPDPAVLRLTLTRLGAPGPVVYVGDMDVDVATARAHGCPVVGVAWGYDPAACRSAGPDAWITRASDLPAVAAALAG